MFPLLLTVKLVERKKKDEDTAVYLLKTLHYKITKF